MAEPCCGSGVVCMLRFGGMVGMLTIPAPLPTLQAPPDPMPLGPAIMQQLLAANAGGAAPADPAAAAAAAPPLPPAMPGMPAVPGMPAMPGMPPMPPM